MKDRNMKRIGAIIILIIIALLYAATLVFAVMDSPLAKSCLMASLFCTIVLPVMAYVYIKLIAGLRDRKKTEEESIDE